MLMRDPRVKQQIDPNGTYRIMRKMLVGGVDLMVGDYLPKDSVLRSQPHKILRMIQYRFLDPVLMPVNVERAECPQCGFDVASNLRTPTTPLIEEPEPRKVAPKNVTKKAAPKAPAKKATKTQRSTSDLRSQLAGMTLKELRDEAIARKLPTWGRKDVVAERIRAAL